MTHIVWDFNPELFWGSFRDWWLNYFPVVPRWYGVTFASGILGGFYIMQYFFKKEGKSEELLNTAFILFVVGTIIGARLGHCLFYEPGFYLSHPLEILYIWKGGLASHGGTIGIFICMVIFVNKYKKDINFLWLADRLSIAISFGVPFIRIGNFFNSEIIGRPSDLPWAVIFKRVDNVPRHPAQLYEALSYWLVCILLLISYKKLKDKPGKLIGYMFIGIFTARFFIEFLKEDQTAFEKGMILNMGQLLSIPFVALGIFFVMGGYQWAMAKILPAPAPQKVVHNKSKRKRKK